MIYALKSYYYNSKLKSDISSFVLTDSCKRNINGSRSFYMRQKILFAIFFVFCSLILITDFFGADNVQAAKVSHKGPSVYYPSVKYEFAPVAEGIEVRHDFVVQNKGGETLYINKVKSG
jgi:hypothetical protein